MAMCDDFNLYETTKPTSRWKSPTCSLLTLLVSFGLAAPINALAVDWVNSGGGTFSTGANWAGGTAPSNIDSANFNLGSAGYTVSLFGNQTTDRLAIGNDSVTLNLGNFTYSQTHLSGLNSSVDVGTGVMGSASLTILNGTLDSNNSVVGLGVTNAVMNVSTGTTWNTGFTSVGTNGQINVLNGATVNAFSTNVSSGILTLDGAGSSWTGSLGNATRISNGGTFNVSNGATYTGTGINGGLIVESGSTALIGGVGTIVNSISSVGIGSGVSTLTVQNGATLNGGTLIGDFGGGDGIVNVKGAGTTWNANSGALSVLVGGQNQGFLNISEGAVATSGLTQVGFENGGFVTVDGVGTQFTSNSLAIGTGDDASLNVSGGATVTTVVLDVGSSAADDRRLVTVDVGGAGSSLNATLNMSVTSSSLSGDANNTSVTVHDGASMTVANRLKVTQGIVSFINGGSGTIGTGAVETAANTLRIYADGDLQLNTKPINTAADTVLNAGVIELAGNLSGSGIINANLNNSGGRVGPGNSFVNETQLGVFAGTLLVNGDYTQDATGELVIGLAGLNPLHDLLDISGTATLDGLLSVSLGDLFTPVLGDSFDILTADTIFGQFSSLDTLLSPLDAGLAWDVSYILDPTLTDTVRLSVVSAVPVPSAAWLFISGLIGLVGVSRRRA